MKKKVLLFILLLLVAHLACLQAQPQNTGKNIIKSNFLSLPFSTWNLQYERLFAKKSVQLSVAYINDFNFIETRMSGTYLTVDYKIYLNVPQKGFKNYIAPYIRYENIYFEDDPDAIRVNTVGGGFLYGWMIYFFKTDWLVLDLYGGVNYIPKTYTLEKGMAPPNIDLPITLFGVGGRFGASLGVRF